MSRLGFVACVLSVSSIAHAQLVSREDSDGHRARVAGIVLTSLASAASLAGGGVELARTPASHNTMSDLETTLHRVVGGALVGVGAGMLTAAIALGVRDARHTKQRGPTLAVSF